MRKVLLRLPDNVYDALKSDAAERGKSMNASAIELFSTFFELAASTPRLKSDSTPSNASTKVDSTSTNAITNSDSVAPTASTILAQFASIPVVSPAVLAHLSESDALSVEYVARADGRWSNAP